MEKQVLVTPYFFEQDRSAFREIMREGWVWNDRHPDPTGHDEQHRILPIHNQITTFIRQAAHDGDLAISLAGDCSATIPVLGGLQQAGIAPLLIWFDSHGDFNTWETTPSNFLGGMPLAMIAGFGEQTLMQAAGATPLTPTDIILTDGRDLDPGEDTLVANAGLLHLTDPADLLTKTLPDKPVYIHFDCDVMRLSDTPAVSYPAEGGPPMEQLRAILKHLRDSDQLIALSATLWNPNMRGAAQSKKNVMSLLEELL